MARPRRTKAQPPLVESDKTFDAEIITDKRFDNITSTPMISRPVRQASVIKGSPIQSSSKQPVDARPVKVTKAAAKKILAAAKPRPSLGGGLPVKAPRVGRRGPVTNAARRTKAASEEPVARMDVDEEDGLELDDNHSDGPDPLPEEPPEVEEEEEAPPPAKPKRGARTTKAKPAASKASSEPKPKSAPTRKVPARAKKNQSIREADESLTAMAVEAAAAAVTTADAPEEHSSLVPKNCEPMDFAKLKITRVINESAQSKMITFLASYNDQDAVIRLEKTLFHEEAIKKALINKDTLSNQDFANDVYSSYLLVPRDSSNALNDLKATVICPANETVIAKYSQSEKIFFSETPDAYLKVVEPFIDSKLTGNYNQWVYNILDGESEVERVLMNDPDPDSGFMIVPDLKWSGDEKDLYLVAICHRRDIRSLRDLNDKHLILLKNILTKGTKAIKEKYKKAKGQLRSYIHYHPSFYHFHVHFKMVDASDYNSTDRDNLLSTVINNISLNKDYYKKSTLTYPLSQSSALYQELKKAKRII